MKKEFLCGKRYNPTEKVDESEVDKKAVKAVDKKTTKKEKDIETKEADNGSNK